MPDIDMILRVELLEKQMGHMIERYNHLKNALQETVWKLEELSKKTPKMEVKLK